MKNLKLITFVISIFYFFISCSNEKKLQITGFAYKNENIRVLENKKIIFDLRIIDDKDANKLCVFFDTIFLRKDSNVKLNVIIDSRGISVLDTCLIIPKKFIKPSIFFVCPSVKSKFKRIIFSDDENKYAIY